MLKNNIIKGKIYEKGYTIREISNLLDINEQTITNWINGRNIKQIEKFIMLLNILEININEIIKKDS